VPFSKRASDNTHKRGGELGRTVERAGGDRGKVVEGRWVVSSCGAGENA